MNKNMSVIIDYLIKQIDSELITFFQETSNLQFDLFNTVKTNINQFHIPDSFSSTKTITENILICLKIDTLINILIRTTLITDITFNRLVEETQGYAPCILAINDEDCNTNKNLIPQLSDLNLKRYADDLQSKLKKVTNSFNKYDEYRLFLSTNNPKENNYFSKTNAFCYVTNTIDFKFNDFFFFKNLPFSYKVIIEKNKTRYFPKHFNLYIPCTVMQFYRQNKYNIYIT